MSYAPYVQGGSQNNKTTTQQSTTTSSTSSSYNPYAAYQSSTPAPAPAASTSGGYGAPSSSYGASSSGYGPPITSTSTTSSYGAGTSGYATSPTGQYQQTQAVATSIPGPVAPPVTSSTTDRGKNPLSSFAGMASALGGGGGGGTSSTYSTNHPPSQNPNYQPNQPIGTTPTNGLVSVGNPSKCHKID